MSRSHGLPETLMIPILIKFCIAINSSFLIQRLHFHMLLYVVYAFFSELSSGRLLLLSGDKGYSQEEDLLGRDTPHIAIHGSFSMMVNYHAIGEYVCNQGGRLLHRVHSNSHLHVSGYLFGQHPTGYLETALSFHEAVKDVGDPMTSSR